MAYAVGATRVTFHLANDVYTDNQYDSYNIVRLTCPAPASADNKCADRAHNPIQLALGCVICTVGMILFRLTNIQRHQFRRCIADGGDLSTYMVWGNPWLKTP